ncbi:type IV secretory system conjugative DNA transfer family protein [Desulfovibrio sp. TomC]|uniref:type IV secretory system conjugative DNA transfer family protein n=1 Tax=Desulfovibrio sp. TomC TaxID=1562888 RepID=UPI000573213F|nr:type IV secretory system conjugative DNA transfer family protein [Desulfovibrio sp. TomC]KHK00369.1 Type IV secretion system protein VirD4 [Desulfovibrio sp. TomC]
MSSEIIQHGLGGIKTRRKLWRWGYLIFMVLLALVSLSLATQQVANIFGNHPSLGKPWGSVFGMAWYAPWKILSWHQWSNEYEAVRRAEFYGQMLFIVPQFLFLGFALLNMRKPKQASDLHGSAHWAAEDEIKEMGLLGGQGIYVGGWVQKFHGWQAVRQWLHGRRAQLQRYLRHDGPEHVLLYAPTRSGKGVGIILPTLLSYPDSTVSLDIKGENWALTAGWRHSQGHKVLRFDPSDASSGDDRIGTCFNPLEEVRLDTLQAIPDVQNIATMIVDPEGKGLQDYWAKAGFAFIAGALLHCLVWVRHKQKRPATLSDLGNMLADKDRTIEQLFEEMLNVDHAALVAECFPSGAIGGEDIHTFIASSAREMLNKSANECSGVVGTAVSNLALYRDPVVAMNTARSDFRIRDLLHFEKPVSLYLVVSPTDVNRVRPLLRLILNLIISRICERMEFENGVQKKPPRRLLMLLDEFTSIGKMEVVNKSIAYAAGYGINYLLVIQNIEQLNETYGKENGIKGNCHIRIAYAPNTLETGKELSEMTGKTTVVTEKTSLSGSRSGHLKNASVSVSETARPLLTPDECMRLPGLTKEGGKAKKAGDMLIFVAGRSPIYGRQILYFLDPVFSDRVKVPTPVQSDSLNRATTANPKAQTSLERQSGYAAYLKAQEVQA